MIAQLNEIAQVWWQWMAGMFWQVSLLIILITILDMAIRRWAWPQVRYVLWGLVFIKLIIPPTWQMPTSIISWIQPQVENRISIQIAPFEVTADYQGISASGLSSSTNIAESTVKKEMPSWQAVVLLTWFAGMIAFSLILIIRLSRLPRRSKKQDDQDVPEWFQGLLSKTAQDLKLRKTPTVIFSNNAKSPAVYGIFRPVLLLPERCLDQLSQKQAEHILIHELCHLKRGDLLVHWFCLILQVIYWFNPLLIWTRRQMRHVCEICCDLSVANLLREKTMHYRNTLLATAREFLTETTEPGLGLLGVFEEPFKLVTRLKWLEKKTWENRKRKIAANICTSLIMVVCVMPMAGLSKTATQPVSNPDESNGQQIQNEFRLVLEGIDPNTFAVEKNKSDASVDVTGRVRLTNGPMILNSVNANIFFYQPPDTLDKLKTTPIKSFSANGDVEIKLDNTVATSQKALYESKIKMITLTGEPKIVREGDTIMGDVIRINCVSGTIIIETPAAIKTLEVSNKKVITFDTLIIEVDADKDLDLGAEWVIPPPGSQKDVGTLPGNDSYAVRTAMNPASKIGNIETYSYDYKVLTGSQTTESQPEYKLGYEHEDEEGFVTTNGDLPDNERVEILYGPAGTQIPEGEPNEKRWVAGQFRPQIDEEGFIELPLPSDSPGLFSTEKRTVDVVTRNPSANSSAGKEGTIEATYPSPPWDISMGQFKKDIIIEGESFPDIAAVMNSMKAESNTYILGMHQRQMETRDNEETEETLYIGEAKSSKLSLKITPKIIKEGLIQQTNLLKISRSVKAMSKPGLSMAVNFPGIIEEGSTTVMICTLRIDNTMEKENNKDGTKLYIFLTPHIEKL